MGIDRKIYLNNTSILFQPKVEHRNQKPVKICLWSFSQEFLHVGPWLGPTLFLMLGGSAFRTFTHISLHHYVHIQ